MGDYKLSNVQSKILDIFINIKKICEENNIRYFAIGGTCIGAVRHKGFIPWDDDLDIAMPGKDFEKFTKIAPQMLPDYLKLLIPKSMPHNNSLFIKIHDIRTTFVESQEKEYKEEYKGVFVDIMPLYGIPAGQLRQKCYYLIVRNIQRLNHKRRVPFNRCSATAGKILWVLTKPINCFIRYDFWADLWFKYVSRYDFDKEPFTGYIWSHNIGRLIFDKSWFEDYVELPFETTTMHCPIGWDLYLTQQFGDYMKLPPEEKRENHGKDTIIDLNKSYKYYQKLSEGKNNGNRLHHGSL